MCTQSCLRVSASPQAQANFTLDLCFDDSGQMYHREVNNLFYTKVKGHGAYKPKVTLPPQPDILFFPPVLLSSLFSHSVGLW